jgi:hypothetical protein
MSPAVPRRRDLEIRPQRVPRLRTPIGTSSWVFLKNLGSVDDAGGSSGDRVEEAV